MDNDFNEKIYLHIDYECITLKELSYCIDLVNKSVNDFYRENFGITNYQINEYSPIVLSVKEGSVIFELLTKCKLKANELYNHIIKRLKKEVNFSVNIKLELEKLGLKLYISGKYSSIPRD